MSQKLKGRGRPQASRPQDGLDTSSGAPSGTSVPKPSGIMIALAADNHTLICLTPHGLEVRLPSEPTALEAQLRQMLLALHRPKQVIPQDFSIVLSEWRRLDDSGPCLHHGAGKIPRSGTATATQRPTAIRVPEKTRGKNFIPLEQLPEL